MKGSQSTDLKRKAMELQKLLNSRFKEGKSLGMDIYIFKDTYEAGIRIFKDGDYYFTVQIFNNILKELSQMIELKKTSLHTPHTPQYTVLRQPFRNTSLPEKFIEHEVSFKTSAIDIAALLDS